MEVLSFQSLSLPQRPFFLIQNSETLFQTLWIFGNYYFLRWSGQDGIVDRGLGICGYMWLGGSNAGMPSVNSVKEKKKSYEDFHCYVF